MRAGPPRSTGLRTARLPRTALPSPYGTQASAHPTRSARPRLAPGLPPPRAPAPQEGAAGSSRAAPHDAPHRCGPQAGLQGCSAPTQAKQPQEPIRGEAALGVGYFSGWRGEVGEGGHGGNNLASFCVSEDGWGVDPLCPNSLHHLRKRNASWFPARTGGVFKWPSWGLTF